MAKDDRLYSARLLSSCSCKIYVLAYYYTFYNEALRFSYENKERKFIFIAVEIIMAYTQLPFNMGLC